MYFYLNNHDFFSPHPEGEIPDVSFLPAMQRRKISALTKMALSGAEKTLGGKKDICVVFASRFGEWGQTLKQIHRYIDEGEISPTGFGFSVHNTAVGLLSILKEFHKPYTAISAGNNTFDAGIIESATMLTHEQEVLFIYAGETVPQAYIKAFAGSSYRPMAIALLLGREPSSAKAVRLHIEWSAGAAPGQSEDCLQAQAFVDFVLFKADKFSGKEYRLTR